MLHTLVQFWKTSAESNLKSWPLLMTSTTETVGFWGRFPRLQQFVAHRGGKYDTYWQSGLARNRLSSVLAAITSSKRLFNFIFFIFALSALNIFYIIDSIRWEWHIWWNDLLNSRFPFWHFDAVFVITANEYDFGINEPCGLIKLALQKCTRINCFILISFEDRRESVSMKRNC